MCIHTRSILNIIALITIYFLAVKVKTYWVVRKVRADFAGKLKRRRFKF